MRATANAALSLALPGLGLGAQMHGIRIDSAEQFVNTSGMRTTIRKLHATLTTRYPAGGPLEAHRVGIVVDGPARVDGRNLTIDCDFNLSGLPTSPGCPLVARRRQRDGRQRRDHECAGPLTNRLNTLATFDVPSTRAARRG